MFIDGLDEFDGQYHGVIKKITDLSEQRHVKICVSSRPLLVFANAFKGKPCLRLQDLTFDTIREYINLQLSQLIHQHASYSKNAQQIAKMLVDMIVERADGVFLWAVIATREVRDGLQGMVDLDQLAQAIEVLPRELEDLFLLVLKHIKLAFRREAAKYLQIILFTHDDRLFDLCRLHLISTQREHQDAPFVYENVAMSELTKACHTLETRLISHTAGLLELTPGDRNYPGYYKRKDWDQILFTRVQFIHRTMRDFLMNNSEAKSFLNDFGLSEAQVHLCIARGTLAQLVQHAEGDAVMLHRNDDAVDWPHPMFDPFQVALRHIAIAERLSGRAQTKLMQSLDYTSLVRSCNIPTRPHYLVGECQAFSMDEAGTSIDTVGMAAAAGMTIYVCEQLGLSVSSAGCNPCFPEQGEYSKTRAAPACLSWKTLDQLPDTVPSGHTPFPGSTYRQVLSNYLQCGEGAQGEDEQTRNYPLAESYILCCCEPTSIDLVRILLKAGANPSVEVWPVVCKFVLRHSGSFWSRWLRFLMNMREGYMNANGKSGGILVEERHDRRVTLSDIFEVTKALLVQGADVNFPFVNHERHWNTEENVLKRHYVGVRRFKLRITATAMFILEECFNTEPEFQEFAAATSQLIKRPTREILNISFVGEGSNYWDTCDVSTADSEVLWPMIEKWERTGHQKDLTALQTAMEQIYNANAPVSGLDDDSEEEGGTEAERESEGKFGKGYKAE